MRKIINRIGWLTIFMFFITESSFAQLQIDSVKTTNSTCPNNGSISIYAKGGAAPLLYSIVAGPLMQPLQTSNIFNALPPGNYTVKVTDALSNSISKTAVI